MKTFHLFRVNEECVAEGIVWTDGRVVLRWLSGITSMECYDSISDLRSVRELSGRSILIFAEDSIITTP